jgi:hypothetical protein
MYLLFPVSPGIPCIPGILHSLFSSDEYRYRIDDLLPGAHTVTAQHDGFQAVTVSPHFCGSQLGGFHDIMNDVQGNRL